MHKIQVHRSHGNITTAHTQVICAQRLTYAEHHPCCQRLLPTAACRTAAVVSVAPGALAAAMGIAAAVVAVWGSPLRWRWAVGPFWGRPPHAGVHASAHGAHRELPRKHGLSHCTTKTATVSVTLRHQGSTSPAPAALCLTSQGMGASCSSQQLGAAKTCSRGSMLGRDACSNFKLESEFGQGRTWAVDPGGVYHGHVHPARRGAAARHHGEARPLRPHKYRPHGLLRRTSCNPSATTGVIMHTCANRTMARLHAACCAHLASAAGADCQSVGARSALLVC